jgi:homeobox protein cut-like
MGATDEISPSDFSSPLTVVCSYWKEFDLDTMRNKLDDVGLRIAELQEEAVQNRKMLSDSTRKLRRDDAASITPGVGGLLRKYQEEIDRLSKRAKHSESAFLEVYQKLFDAPDPAPLLQAAFVTATRAAELEAQLMKVSQELAEYKVEAEQIKNQDLTIRKMEERMR